MSIDRGRLRIDVSQNPLVIKSDETFSRLCENLNRLADIRCAEERKIKKLEIALEQINNLFGLKKEQ